MLNSKIVRAWKYRGVSAESRFWKHVLRRSDAECWTWTGSRNRFGYGMLKIMDLHIVAHRASWLFTKGDIPGGLYVLHTCDNPWCVNPGHLWLGTYRDNILDAYRKGRLVPNRGEDVGTSKLTWKQVREIRHLYSRGGINNKMLLGRMFGVSDTMIRNIVTGRWWKHDPQIKVPILRRSNRADPKGEN